MRFLSLKKVENDNLGIGNLTKYQSITEFYPFPMIHFVKDKKEWREVIKPFLGLWFEDDDSDCSLIHSS